MSLALETLCAKVYLCLHNHTPTSGDVPNTAKVAATYITQIQERLDKGQALTTFCHASLSRAANYAEEKGFYEFYKNIRNILDDPHTRGYN